MLIPRWSPLVAMSLVAGFQLGTFHQKMVDVVLSRELAVDDKPPLPPPPAPEPVPEEEDDNTALFFPFTIRDSKRLVPNQPDPNMQIFDYLDINQQNQAATNSKSQLFFNARPVKIANQTAFAPCEVYNLMCYKAKILQVFHYVLETAAPDAEYFFYVEADNELCLPMKDYRKLALKEQRYFLSTGVGFSGWMMHRSFLEEFVAGYYRDDTKEPDIFGSKMLMKNHTWAVTQKYLVSHTIVPSLGHKGLTVRAGRTLQKHLPRCFEPRRSKWPNSPEDPRDKFGWDYFDYDACPDAHIFPCQPGQRQAMVQLEEKYRSIAATLTRPPKGGKGAQNQPNRKPPSRGVHGGPTGQHESPKGAAGRSVDVFAQRRAEAERKTKQLTEERRAARLAVKEEKAAEAEATKKAEEQRVEAAKKTVEQRVEAAKKAAAAKKKAEASKPKPVRPTATTKAEQHPSASDKLKASLHKEG